MRKGLSWMVQKGLGWMGRGEEVNEVKKKEVEKMRKGLSIIAGIAVLLFAYSVSAGVVTDGLVSWWKLEEGPDGTTATDHWTNNNGTLLGNPAWTSNNLAGSATDWALHFDGTGDYVNCGNPTNLHITGDITIETWIKVATNQTSYAFFVHRGRIGYNTDGFDLYLVGGKPFFDLSDTEGYDRLIGNAIINDGFWHHLVAKADSTTKYIYVDGQLDTNNARTKDPVYTNSYDFYLGRGYKYLDGTMDEVRIYNKALSGNEIEQNYGAIPEPSALLLLGGGLLGLLVFRQKSQRVKKI